MTTVAVESHDLMSDLCRQFGQVSGWDLHYTPARRAPDEIRLELESRASCCWISEVNDGSRVAGFLHLESLEDESDPYSSLGRESTRGDFVEATMFAEILARIL